MIAILCKRRFVWAFAAAAALALRAGPAPAQVTAIVVGVTPTCPYGFPGCWAGAKEALGELADVQSVTSAPDLFNCTAHLRLKQGGLPDVVGWPTQFKKLVGQTYTFRGVEVTIKGTVEPKDGSLILKAPGVKQTITLVPLENKLQWNFKKAAARQPEPDERKAYRQLAVKQKKAKGSEFKVDVTGPLRQTDQGLILEVREFFMIDLETNKPRQD